jgi:MatE protein
MARSPYDREILALALPALGALAAEPLYVLVDTAIVGHLGTTQLASLAIAAAVMGSAFTVFNFLTYGTTAQVARLHGAGQEAEAARTGAQAQWLGLLIGLALALTIAALAVPLTQIMGGDGGVEDGAVTYLRIAALGGPFFMLASAGQGFLRGIGDLKTPLVILIAAHALNVVLELLFVYGFDWGLAGSAWGTLIAQFAMAAAFLRVQLKAGWEPPHWQRIRRLARIGGEIAVRTTALLAAFLVARQRRRPGRAPDRLPAIRVHRARARRRGDRRPGDGRADARRRRRPGSTGRVAPDDRLERRGRLRLRPGAAGAGRRDPARVHQRPGGDRAGARDLADLRADDARQRRRLRARRDPDRRRRHALSCPGDGGVVAGRDPDRGGGAGGRLGDRRRLGRAVRADRDATGDLPDAVRRAALGPYRCTRITTTIARHMRRRLACIPLLLALLVPAPVALAQSGSGNAFGPLPQAAPAPTPTPTPVKNSSQDEIGRGTLLLIAAGVAVVFVGLGIAVTRDARRNLSEHDREAIARSEAGQGTGVLTAKQRNAAKAKARQKQKAARAARKRTTRNR